MALALLDYVMVEGKTPVWNQIAAKAFITSLVSVLKTRDSPEVQEKILYLIKKWGVRFESYKEILPNFTEIYQGMKNSNVVFPDKVEPDYYKYIGEDNQEDNNNYSNDFNNNFPEESEGNSKNSIQLDLNPNNYEKKYATLLQKMQTWIENIKLTNDMIDNTQVGTQVDDGLKSVVESLRTADGELIVNIQEKVKDEKLLEMLLGINDDINRTMTRYDLVRARKKPDPFFSYFQNDRQFQETKPLKKPEKKTYTNSNIHSNSVSNKPNDIFDLLGTDNSSKNVNVKSSQNAVKNVDEIFDIFNSKPVESKQSQAPINNNMGGMNNDNKQNFDLFSNQTNPSNVNNTNNINSNVDNKQEKKGIDLLAEKLKNAYLGNDDKGQNMSNNNQKNMFDFTMVKYD